MPEDFQAEHERAFKQAMAIYVAKSRTRGQLWLEYPPSDKLRELRERIDRLEHAYKLLDDDDPKDRDLLVHEMLEDSYDMLNFVNFFIKQLNRGMRG